MLDSLLSEAIAEYLQKICDRYISFRPRTEYEFRRYITSKFNSPKFQKRFTKLSEYEAASLLDATILLLIDQKYINDQEFAEWYVREKNDFKPRGRYRLSSELKQKGVEQDVIDKAFEKYGADESLLIHKILSPRYNPDDFNDPDFKRKFIQKLQRKGFRYGDINLAIEEFIEKE